MRNHRILQATIAVVVAAVGSISAHDVAATTNDALTVPSGSLAGLRYHVVAPGDSVASIARAYGVDAGTIRIANGLVGDRLYQGARVLLDAANPTLTRRAGGGSSSTPPAANSSSGTPSSDGASARTYVVEEGDVLERIARRAGVKLSALLSANGLESTSVILPGRKLVIPGGSSTSTSTSSSTSSGGGSGSAPTSTSWIGPDMVCPVPGASFMNDWGFPRGSERFHEGTDLFAPEGTTIVAPVSGVVSFGSNDLGGTTFNLSTADGWVVYGAHLSDTIGSGGQVTAGTPIGRVGNSGDAEGGDTHLHLMIRPAAGRPANAYPSIAASC